MTKANRERLKPANDAFKPGYEGERPGVTMTAPERQTLRQHRRELVDRIHTAMLTLTVMGGGPRQGVAAGGTPTHILEFSDRVGEERQEPAPLRFRPTAVQVSDMDPALKLLEGLRPTHFKVVMFRALQEFAKNCGEPGNWSWESIGGYFGFSDRWAEAVYDVAIVQAARRAGILPMVSQDFAVLVASTWVNHSWLSNISTTGDPRQALANLRVKSPVPIASAFSVWVAGPPVAKRLMDSFRAGVRNLNSHASWYKSHPDVMADSLVQHAREMGADWLIEEIAVKGAQAA